VLLPTILFYLVNKQIDTTIINLFYIVALQSYLKPRMEAMDKKIPLAPVDSK
jgi:hypothetical protein